MIVGLGIDLVKIDRIEKLVDTWDKKFLNKIYTKEEIQYCSRHKRSAQHYASTFAVKEAFIKAHGRGNINFKDIEVIRGKTGKPKINLYNNAKDIIQNKSIINIHVTITHDADYSVAAVILEH